MNTPLSHAFAPRHLIRTCRAIVVLESNTGYVELHALLEGAAGGRASLRAEAAQRALKDLVFARWAAQGCEERTDTLKMVRAGAGGAPPSQDSACHLGLRSRASVAFNSFSPFPACPAASARPRALEPVSPAVGTFASAVGACPLAAPASYPVAGWSGGLLPSLLPLGARPHRPAAVHGPGGPGGGGGGPGPGGRDLGPRRRALPGQQGKPHSQFHRSHGPAHAAGARTPTGGRARGSTAGRVRAEGALGACIALQ